MIEAVEKFYMSVNPGTPTVYHHSFSLAEARERNKEIDATGMVAWGLYENGLATLTQRRVHGGFAYLIKLNRTLTTRDVALAMDAARVQRVR